MSHKFFDKLVKKLIPNLQDKQLDYLGDWVGFSKNKTTEGDFRKDGFNDFKFEFKIIKSGNIYKGSGVLFGISDNNEKQKAGDILIRIIPLSGGTVLFYYHGSEIDAGFCGSGLCNRSGEDNRYIGESVGYRYGFGGDQNLIVSSNLRLTRNLNEL